MQGLSAVIFILIIQLMITSPFFIGGYIFLRSDKNKDPWLTKFSPAKQKTVGYLLITLGVLVLITIISIWMYCFLSVVLE